MLINYKTLNYLKTGMGEDSVQELIDLYLTTSPEVLHNIQEAIQEQDSEKLAFWSHRLKGSSCTLGFDDIQNLSEETETLSRQGDVKGAALKFETIVPLYKKLEETLRARGLNAHLRALN